MPADPDGHHGPRSAKVTLLDGQVVDVMVSSGLPPGVRIAAESLDAIRLIVREEVAAALSVRPDRSDARKPARLSET